MRADILTANRDAVLEALDTYRAELDGLRDALARNDHPALLAILEDSLTHRDRWIKQQPSTPDSEQ